MEGFCKLPREITDRFINFATGPGGIPGGNPDGKLWFCGIEFGKVDPNEPIYYYLYLDPSSGVPCWTEKFKNKYHHTNKELGKNYTIWQFNQKQAKIARAYMTGSLDGWYDYLKDRFYAHDGETFGVNLYPLAFHDVSDDLWSKAHYRETGFPSKTEYMAWCSQHRFPKLKQRLTKHSPKALVCTGNAFKRMFLLAFADSIDQIFDDKINERPVYTRRGNPVNVEWLYINSGKTLMVITPFLGRGGLMSDASLMELAKLLREKTAAR